MKCRLKKIEPDSKNSKLDILTIGTMLLYSDATYILHRFQANNYMFFIIPYEIEYIKQNKILKNLKKALKTENIYHLNKSEKETQLKSSGLNHIDLFKISNYGNQPALHKLVEYYK